MVDNEDGLGTVVVVVVGNDGFIDWDNSFFLLAELPDDIDEDERVVFFAVNVDGLPVRDVEEDRATFFVVTEWLYMLLDSRELVWSGLDKSKVDDVVVSFE